MSWLHELSESVGKLHLERITCPMDRSFIFIRFLRYVICREHLDFFSCNCFVHFLFAFLIGSNMLIVKGRGAAAMFLPELRGRMVCLYQIVFSRCEELSSRKLHPEACNRYVEIKERAHVSGFDFVVPISPVAGIHFFFFGDSQEDVI